MPLSATASQRAPFARLSATSAAAAQLELEERQERKFNSAGEIRFGHAARRARQGARGRAAPRVCWYAPRRAALRAEASALVLRGRVARSAAKLALEARALAQSEERERRAATEEAAQQRLEARTARDALREEGDAAARAEAAAIAMAERRAARAELKLVRAAWRDDPNPVGDIALVAVASRRRILVAAAPRAAAA